MESPSKRKFGTAVGGAVADQDDDDDDIVLVGVSPRQNMNGTSLSSGQDHVRGPVFTHASTATHAANTHHHHHHQQQQQLPSHFFNPNHATPQFVSTAPQQPRTATSGIARQVSRLSVDTLQGDHVPPEDAGSPSKRVKLESPAERQPPSPFVEDASEDDECV